MYISLAGSAILYHILTLQHATMAVQKDALRLAPVVGNDFEQTLGAKMYFLSAARSRYSDYFRNNNSGNKVIFVLDGEKIGHNYEVRPVNYWHNSQYNKDDEMEDRIFSNKPSIPLLRYLKSVHFVVSPHFNGSDTLGLIAACKRANIPVYQYADREELLTLDPKKAIPVVATKQVQKLGKGLKAYEDGYELKALWSLLSVPKEKIKRIRGKPSVGETFVARGKQYAAALRKMADFATGSYGMTSTDASNLLRGGRSEMAQKYRHKIVAYMKKHGLTHENLRQHLRDKWTS